MYGRKKILFIGTDNTLLSYFSANHDTEVISSVSFLDSVLFGFIPDLIIFESVYDVDILRIRRNGKLSFVPVLIIIENLAFLNNFDALCQVPRVLLCNGCVVKQERFLARLLDVMAQKAPLLQPRTAKFVKQAVLYINKNVARPFSREDVAAAVGVTEDYLSRIFRRELGLALWDYVLVYRLYEARSLLVETGLSNKEIARRTGFEDAAYFSRMFRRLYGMAPGKFRNQTG